MRTSGLCLAGLSYANVVPMTYAMIKLCQRRAYDLIYACDASHLIHMMDASYV